MTTRDDFDSVLGSWLEAEAIADGAATLLERTLAVTAQRRPRPAWIAHADGARRARLLPIDDRGRSRLAYAMLLAAAIVALLVGAVFFAGQRPPRLSQPLACAGVDTALCGHTAGRWTSQTFTPGLMLTWPNDAWYTRDLPDRLELKTMPMTSAVIVHLDPLPAGPGPEQERAGDVASLIRWLRTAPGAVIEMVGERTTPTGLRVTTWDIRAIDPRAPVALFVPRENPAAPAIVEANHYAQRLHLVDLGGGHVLSILVVAYDSDHETVRRTDTKFDPILDSIRPPASFSP